VSVQDRLVTSPATVKAKSKSKSSKNGLKSGLEYYKSGTGSVGVGAAALQ